MTLTFIEEKNLYENCIKEEIARGLDSEVQNQIAAAPSELQRSMLLTVLEENNPEHRLMCSKIRKLVETKNLYSAKHIKNIVKMLREYVEVSDTEVKTMGEVMTPTFLVEEMLDTLPYEVWTNPDLKWLDPCNGVGIFPAVVVERLMKGLTDYEPNEELRYKHILENMLYITELQAKNMFLFLYAFDPEDKFALNVYQGNYLDKGFDNHMKFWGIEKFDVIVMNPPYQVLKEGNRKSQAIWDKFVIKSIDNLIEAGYLVAVHPDGWRSASGQFKNVQTILKSKQLMYLEMHNVKEGIKTFGAETSYDFYCLHNVPNTMFTKIKCQDGTIERADLSKMEFIPNGMFKTFENLIAKDGEERVEILYSRSAYGTDKVNMSKEKTEEYQHPCVYYTYVDYSLRLMYSNTNQKGHFGTPKVIWSEGRSSMPIIDNDGEYGLTQFAYAIVDDIKNLPFIQKAMLHPNFLKLMSFTNGSGQKYNRKAIALFRKDFWKDYQY